MTSATCSDIAVANGLALGASARLKPGYCWSPILARRLLRFLFGVWVFLIAGCVLPQDEYYIEDLPPLRNRPPLVVESLASPPGHSYRISGGLCDIKFDLKVGDPDVTDRLYYRFYIDYVFQTPQSPEPTNAIYKEGIIEPSPTREIVRNETVTFATLDRTHRIFQLGEHVVEALISDTRIASRDDVLAEDGQREVGKVFYTWLVSVTGPCQ
jgi:hypothetical protein